MWEVSVESNLTVRFKKLHPDAVVPRYAKPGDAGLDLVAVAGPTKQYNKDYIEYRTGLAVEIPDGYVGLVFPRSSISNYHLSLCNAVGVVDSGYRGEIIFRFTVFGSLHYKKGDRIGQLVIMPFPRIQTVEAEELSDTVRGGGGFGSSGS